MFEFMSFVIAAVVLIVELFGAYLFYKGYKAQLLNTFATLTILRYREKFWLAYDLLIGLLIVGCIWFGLAPISLTIFLILNVMWLSWAYYQNRTKREF